MAIAAMRGAEAERHIALDRVSAAEAIAPAVVDGVDPDTVLDLLVTLGVLASGDAGLRLTPVWSEAYGHLFGPDRVLLEVTEVANAGQPIQPMRMIVLGAGQRRHVTLLPAETRRWLDRRVTFAPLSAPAVFAAGMAVVCGPMTIPEVPGACQPPESTDLAPHVRSWRAATAGQLAIIEPFTQLPRALLHPHATIAVTRQRAAEWHARRSVLAFGASASVQWAMDGALVVWRELDVDAVDTELEALIADGASESSGRAIVLEEDAVCAPVSGAGDPIIPAELASLAGDPTACRYSLRALRRTASGVAGVELTAFHSPSAGWWQVETGDGDTVATPTTAAVLRKALLAAVRD